MPLNWWSRRPDPIAEPLWRQALAGMPFAGHLDAGERERLRALCEAFLARKAFTGAAGLTVTPPMRLAIALQACMPALHLGLGGYDDFVEIVVYPDQFLVPRRQVDEAGVVHEAVEALAGEAMDGGPVVLSWADAAPAQRGVNVVIHEFVHKLDLADGEADGIPPLPRARRAAWESALHAAYDAFCDALDAVERAIPRHVDPEGPEADAWYERLPMDPYAATDEAEFFAVSGEVFFTDPHRLAAAHADWYAQLSAFFRQDPRHAGLR